jgi:glyoxylase-like metal-dependent hydrolase (beta-lactamase superfamily II)
VPRRRTLPRGDYAGLIGHSQDDASAVSAGESLFPGGPGRTTTPDAFNSLMSGLEERVFGRLPDATWIYPGHGNDSTLGAERPHLGEWRARGW